LKIELFTTPGHTLGVVFVS